MLDLFTNDAKRVIFYATEEATRLGDSHVSTEHLLLALLRCESAWVALGALEGLGVSPARLQESIEERLTPGPVAEGEKDLTPRGKRAIDLAIEEHRRLRDEYIGAEHLLIGLLAEEEGIAGRTLTESGLTLTALRAEVTRLQGKPPAPGGPLGWVRRLLSRRAQGTPPASPP